MGEVLTSNLEGFGTPNAAYTLPATHRHRVHKTAQRILSKRGFEFAEDSWTMTRTVADIVRASSQDERDLAVIRDLAQDGEFGLLVDDFRFSSTLKSPQIEYIDKFALQCLSDSSTVERYASSKGTQHCWSATNYDGFTYNVPNNIDKHSMALIGDGPSALMLNLIRRTTGYHGASTKLFGKTKEGQPLRGIWNQQRVRSKGHNTFRPMRIMRMELPIERGRTGEQMQGFLDFMSFMGRPNIDHSMVEGITYDNQSDTYLIHTQSGVERFDAYCICTGNARPKSLDSQSAPVRTNITSVQGVAAKRWQEPVLPEDYTDFVGTPPVIIGLGNSALEQWEEFRTMADAGYPVQPLILTHLPGIAVSNPTKLFGGPDGNIHGPVFRDRSNLSKIAGDIPRVRELYENSLELGGVITGVREWNVYFDDPSDKSTLFMVVKGVDDDGREFQLRINNIPMIYALIGYQNDAKRMRQLGCICDGDGNLDFHPLTHRLQTTHGGDGGYVLGAAASKESCRNEEVLPGILSSTLNISMFEILRSHRRLKTGA